jgi:hypothetical protein
MQRTVGEKTTEPLNDGVGPLLKPEDFEALMIEPVNRILEPPVVGRCIEKLSECLVLPVCIGQERRFKRASFGLGKQRCGRFVFLAFGFIAQSFDGGAPDVWVADAYRFVGTNIFEEQRQHRESFLLVPYNLPATISVFSGVIS